MGTSLSPKFSLLHVWGLDSTLLLNSQQIQRNLQKFLLALLSRKGPWLQSWGWKGSAVSADNTDPHVILLTWWLYASWRFALRYILWNRYRWNYQPANCPSPPSGNDQMSLTQASWTGWKWWLSSWSNPWRRWGCHCKLVGKSKFSDCQHAKQAKDNRQHDFSAVRLANPWMWRKWKPEAVCSKEL